ncbi:unnamed protein product [Triticum turgidum subsp. durum]|uniref:Cytochrome P450 n=2 Tax=Triticum turgidum subsp. durum TaxID=4567 RepID=A0A9R1P4J7_TRITD|nr:unnamed protein product [Triticum turgidum subsp. durum]
MEAYIYLLALLPLLYILRSLRAFFCSGDRGLRLPPGPWQLPIIGNLHHLFGALPHRALRDLSRRHGPLMLLKLGKVPVIVASNAEAAKEIMKTHDHIFCTRPLSSTAKVLNEHGTGITFSPYGAHWRQLRKICVLELLNAKRVKSFRPTREEEVIRFIRSISSSSETQLTVNLSNMLTIYGSDTTVHSTLGCRFKDRDNYTLLDYVAEAVRLIGGYTLSDLFPSSRLARTLSSTLRRAAVFRDSVLSFLERIIDDHLARRSSKEVHQEDLVDALLRIKREGNLAFPLTMNHIKAVILDVFAGGSESPITTLQWAMTELMQNPSVMSRAQAEVRGAFAGQMKVTEEGLANLSYLQCIIKETLRLHAPTPLLLPRECQEQCNILGYDVPKGAIVLVNAWAISRDPEYWEEPEAFIPDRFMGSKVNYNGNNFEFVPFGAGRRICPGVLFGIANIELALASLLFYFDWALPDGILPGDLDMTETMGISAKKKLDLRLRATLHVQLPR